MANTITSDDLGKDNTNQAGNLDNNQPGAGPNSSSQQSNGGGSQAPTVQATGSGPANPNQQKGSGYTNIQKIITANQGNKLGQAVGGGVQQAGQGLQNNLNTSQNQFQQQTAQNQFNTQANQQLVGNVLANPDQYGTSGQNNPNSQQAGQFQNLISGTYQGPTNLANAAQLQGQAQDVGQLNKALGSQAGQAGLLQRFVGNPQYNQGQQNLDSLLLGQTGGQDLSAARRATAGLGNKVNNALLGAQTQGQQATSQAQQFGKQVQDQFGNTVSGLNTGLQQQAVQAQQSRDSAYQNAVKSLQSGQINQQQADLLGLTQGQDVTGNALNSIGQFVTENPLAANAQNIASTQDYAKINALRNLAGQNSPSNAQNILQQYYGQDKNAGAFNSGPAYTGDTQGFNTANQAQLDNYFSQITPAEQAKNDALQKAEALSGTSALGQSESGGSAGGFNFGEAARKAAINQANQQYSSQLQNYLNALNSATSAVGGVNKINIKPQDQT